MRFINVALLLAVAMFFSVSPSSAADLHADVRSFIGRDRSKWVKSVSSVSAAPNWNVAIYAGGKFNISIAKTTGDAAGNIYAIGGELVTVGSYTAHTVFVTKIDPTGATVYTTRLGGKGDDIALSVGVDAAGRVFGGGYTTSPDFPLLHEIQTDPSAEGATGFVFALDASGDLLWSTYFGGSGIPHGSTGSSIKAVAVDGTGNTYVTGTSQNPNLLTTKGAYQSAGNFGTVTEQISNGFVAKFSATGQLIYSTWLEGNLIDCNFQGCFYGGPRIDAGTAIAFDSAGDAFVAGYTDSSDFPVTPGAFQTATPEVCPSNSVCNFESQFYNAFLTKLKPDGSGLVYSTFLGSLGSSSQPPPDGVNKGIALDSAGDAYVAFGTTAVSIPITATGLQTAPSGGSDILLLVLNPTGSALQASTYLGGGGDDFVTEVALDSAGNIYISGAISSATVSAKFPDSYGAFPEGSDFVTELNAAASKILFSARLPGGLAAQDIVLVPGALITAGSSGHIMRLSPFGAASFPALLGAGNAAKGTIDSALLPSEVVTIYGSGIGPATPVSAQPTPHSNSLIAASYPESLGGVRVSFNGQPAALLYVSSTQINLGMPSVTASPVVMTIVNNGATLGPFTIAAVSEAPIPGIFRNANGSAAVLNQDGTLNTPANPAHLGSIIALWGTGVAGLVGGNGGGDGGAIPAQVVNVSSQCFVSLYEGSTNGYLSMPIIYAGGAPGLLGGVFQINAQVQGGFAAGPLAIYLQASGINGPLVTIYIAP